MKRTLFFLSIMVLGLTSCEVTYSHKAKVLENGTIVILQLDDAQNKYLNSGDTVWANLNTLRVDNKDTNTMKVRLITPSTH